MKLFWWRDDKLDRPVISVQVIWKKKAYLKVFSLMTPIEPSNLPSWVERMACEIVAEIDAASKQAP